MNVFSHGLGLILALTFGFGTSAAASAAPLASFDQVRARTRQSEGALLDRNGEIVHELRLDPRFRRLGWVELKLVSPVLKEAVIAAEDHRFEAHGGVDWLALGRAAGGLLLGGGKRGASTISMQLLSFLESGGAEAGRRKGRRGVLEKVEQIRSALELERAWTKDQILEAYLNLVSFRGELQGIAAATEALFGKAPHGLDLRESLVLASLIRAPGARIEQVEKRSCLLGRSLRGPDFDCAEHAAWVEREKLGIKPVRPQAGLAPHLARELLPQGKSRSTLDRRIQAVAFEALRKQVLTVKDRNVHDAAALVVDNRSGEVLAYVGSVGAISQAQYVDGVRARRQAGSTLKPFLYALALEKRHLTAASLLDDSPVDVPVAGGVYRPGNFDQEFRGWVPLRDALASSLNVPAVKTLNLVGVEPWVGFLEKMGFSQLKMAEFYGPSLALGSLDVTLWDLVNAYRTLANGGVRSSLQVTPDGASAPGRGAAGRLMSAEAAFVISDILADRAGRSLTFGLENPLSLRFWSAAKTGTSKDMRDNWCVGYTERFTVGVWVGNFQGEPMWNVSGITGAAPAWAEIMNELHRKVPSRAPKVPRGLLRKTVLLASGTTSGNSRRTEFFLRGTEPRSESDWLPMAPSPSHAKIRYPVDGLLIAIDPDIPPDRQAVFFETDQEAAGTLVWKLNGEVLGPAQEAGRGAFRWEPKLPGKYRLVLARKDGTEIDSVGYEVRGAAPAGAEFPEARVER